MTDPTLPERLEERSDIDSEAGLSLPSTRELLREAAAALRQLEQEGSGEPQSVHARGSQQGGAMTDPTLPERLDGLSKILAILYAANVDGSNVALRDSAWTMTEAVTALTSLEAERDEALSDRDEWIRRAVFLRTQAGPPARRKGK